MNKLLLLGAISFMIMGCGKKSDNEKQIIVWSHASPEHPEGKMFQERAEEYNKKYPEKLPIKVQNFTRAGAGSGYMDKLNAAITASDMPDIFTLDGPDISSYSNAGVLKEIGSIMDPAFMEGFTDSIKEQGSINGEFYGIGYQDSGVIVLYNQKIIDMLPAEIKSIIPLSPEEDWTWEEFYTVSSAIKNLKNNDETKNLEEVKKLEYPVSFALGDVVKGGYEIAMYYLAPIIWSNNSNVISPDGLTAQDYLNGDKTIESLQTFGKFFKDDLAGIIESEKSFHNEKSALAVAGSWYIPDLVNNYPDVNFRALKYPKYSKNFTENYTPSGSWAFVMSNSLEDNSPKLKEVSEALEWLTNDDSVKLYYDKNNSIPVRKSMLSIIETNTPNKNYNEAWIALKNEVENSNKARPSSPIYPYVSESFAKDVISKIAREKVSDYETIKRYVDEATNKIEREARKYRK